MAKETHKQINLLVATGLYPPEGGGPATYSKLLEDELPKRGVSTVVLPFSTVRHLPKVLRHLAYTWKLAGLTKSSTHILALDPVSVGVPAMFVAKIYRKPLITKVVGDYAWEQSTQRFGVTDLLDEFVEKKYSSFFVKFFKFLQRKVAESSTLIITPSNYLKGIVSKWGIKKSKITVIPNAVPNIERANKNALRGVLKYRGFVIITIARLVPWKGIDTLIKAVEAKAGKLPDFRLVIVGDGPELNNLTAIAENSNIKDNIIFTKKLPHNLTMRYLNASDLLVLNTAYEGFSHLLLESLALGVPVVTTNVGGNPELIKTDKNGVLVPYNDKEEISEAILELANDPAKRKLFATNGRNTVKKYSKEIMLTSLIGELRKI